MMRIMNSMHLGLTQFAKKIPKIRGAGYARTPYFRASLHQLRMS